jgi:hypothetical protein
MLGEANQIRRWFLGPRTTIVAVVELAMLGSSNAQAPRFAPWRTP